MRAAEEEFEKTKEICSAQKMGSDAQIEKMEKELARLRAGLVESVQSLEQREMSTNIEYGSLLVSKHRERWYARAPSLTSRTGTRVSPTARPR